MAGRQMIAAIGGPFLVCSLVATAAAQRFDHNSYLGKTPPELVSQRNHWLGGREMVTLDRLKGKVVWLQFNFCEDCVSLRSHLVRWEEEYSGAGLRVVEINQCIDAPLDVMRCMVESKNLKHPVLWDAGCQNTKAYGITAWPYAYLIGADGSVFWEGNPSRWIRRDKEVKEMRRLIEAKLSEAKGRQRP